MATAWCLSLWPGVWALQAVGSLLGSCKAEITGPLSNISLSSRAAKLSLKTCPAQRRPIHLQGYPCAQPQSLRITSGEHSAGTMKANPIETAKVNGSEAAFPFWIRTEPFPTASNAWVSQFKHFSIPRRATIHLFFLASWKSAIMWLGVKEDQKS